MKIERSALGVVLRLAQARLAQGNPASNRTLLLSVQGILDRIGMAKGLSLVKPFMISPAPDLPTVSGGTKDILEAIEAAPTPAELGDLGLVDAFFARDASWWKAFVCANFMARKAMVKSPGWNELERANVPSGPFFCPPEPDLRLDISPWNPAISPVGSFSSYFGLDTSDRWADLRQIILNILNLNVVAQEYPWPGIVQIDPAFYWATEKKRLNDLVRQPGILIRDAARLWITLSILVDWNKLRLNAENVAKEEARAAKTNLILKEVSIIVVGIVIGVAIGAIMVAAEAGAVATTASKAALTYGGQALTAKEKQDAVKTITDAANDLQGSDPGYSGELRWSADYIAGMQTLSESEAEQGKKVAAQAVRQAQDQSSMTGSKFGDAALGIGIPAALSIGLAVLK